MGYKEIVDELAAKRQSAHEDFMSRIQNQIDDRLTGAWASSAPSTAG